MFQGEEKTTGDTIAHCIAACEGKPATSATDDTQKTEVSPTTMNVINRKGDAVAAANSIADATRKAAVAVQKVAANSPAAAEAADNVAVAAEAAAYRVGTAATDAKDPTATADDVAGAARKAATTIQKTAEAAANAEAAAIVNASENVAAAAETAAYRITVASRRSPVHVNVITAPTDGMVTPDSRSAPVTKIRDENKSSPSPRGERHC